MTTRFLCCTIAFVCFSSGASASVISVNDSVFGTDALTRDTVQGLDFLDVSLSVGRSFNDVSAQFGVGGDFEGFRYASELEVLTLINNYGFLPGAIPNVTVTGNTGADQLSGLASLLGVTLIQTDSQLVYGLTATLSTDFPGNYMAPVIVDYFAASTNDVVSSQTVTPSYAGSYIGSYLVKSSPPNPTVPEPTSIALWGIGTVAMTIGAARRRRREKQTTAA